MCRNGYDITTYYGSTKKIMQTSKLTNPHSQGWGFLFIVDIYNKNNNNGEENSKIDRI